jgi:DNA-binding XRE family transcriptional regulator
MTSPNTYDREAFLTEFFPNPADRAQVESGAQTLVNINRAHRLAEMRKRLGLTQAEVAERMNVRQERVSAIERAKVDAGELRTLTAYINALGGKLEIIADFGNERLVIGCSHQHYCLLVAESQAPLVVICQIVPGPQPRLSCSTGCRWPEPREAQRSGP